MYKVHVTQRIVEKTIKANVKQKIIQMQKEVHIEKCDRENKEEFIFNVCPVPKKFSDNK